MTLHTFIKSEFPTLIDRVTIYRRGRLAPVATAAGDEIFHRGSTLTNVVNLAAITNPGKPVRIVGCEYGGSPAHFYPDDPPMRYTLQFQQFVTSFWSGLCQLRQAGIDVRDCNVQHFPAVPEEYRLPREKVFAACA